MNIATAVLVFALAVPAAAAPVPARKILSENADLTVSVTVTGAGAPIAVKARVQAQSQFSAAVEAKGKSPRKMIFNGVPVINPNNGKARMEYKGSASWGEGDAVEFMSAVELELGAEAVVYDSEGVTVRIKITAAEN